MTSLNENDYFRAIGRFVFEFSQLEFTLAWQLAQAIGLADEHLDPVVSAFDFAKLCTTVEAVMAGSLTPEKGAQLKALIKECRGVNDRRVKIVHGLWVVGPGSSGSLHTVSRQSLQRSVAFDTSALELDELSNRTSELRSKLVDVVLSVRPIAPKPRS